MFEVKPYNPLTDKAKWNNFIEIAKNSTFLFNRDFMDYHSDRFEDYSVLVYEKDKIVACLPANKISASRVCSHQGLTYGSFIMKHDLKLPIQIEIFNLILSFYFENGLKELTYKAFPRFYNGAQTDEIEYCLFLNGAQLFRKDTAICIDKLFPIKYSGNIRREAKRAENNGIIVKRSTNFSEFWKQILTPNLESRFGVKPVHSILEIEKLAIKFPDNIQLFVSVDKNNTILAGTVLFVMPNVVHCQYISALPEGRNVGALNLLFTSLIDDYFPKQRYFDFGIANENQGRELNKGLLAWKERLGGRTYSHDFYKIILK